MEPGQEEKDTQHVATLPPASPTEAMHTNSSEPSTPRSASTGHGMGTMQHDSMVTVRLSEPPVLTVDTKIARTSSIASAKAINGHGSGFTPTTETVLEEDGAAQGQSLQDELNEADPNEDMSPISEDEVNWEQLQKTEDQESKDQDSDNVSRLPTYLYLGLFCRNGLRS